LISGLQVSAWGLVKIKKRSLEILFYKTVSSLQKSQNDLCGMVKQFSHYQFKEVYDEKF